MLIKFKYVFVILMFVLPLGCASIISEELRSKASPVITFAEVAAKPIVYKGQTIIWGGEIIECVNQQDGTALIEVNQRPLDKLDYPDLSFKSQGRFLIKSGKSLDPYTYKMGTKITVGGEILGEEIKHVGESDYHYPLVLGREIYIFRESNYYDTPFWYPWWGYPYYSSPSHRHHHH
jgi:starvation-inducible outer membrane lipoprotein